MPKGRGKRKAGAGSGGDSQNAFKRQLLSADYERVEEVFKQARQQYVQCVKDEVNILDQKFKGNKTPKEAFAEWCQEYAGRIYPDLGDVAYAVPPFYFNRHEIKLDDQTGAWRRTRQTEPKKGTDVNSDVRGDAAQRVVGRAFIMLNNTFEKNRQGKQGDRQPDETMFIIGNCMYEHFLRWLIKSRHPGQVETEIFQGVHPQIYQTFKKNDSRRYFTTPGDADVSRSEPDLIILHKKKGVIFVQAKSLGDYQCDPQAGAGSETPDQTKKPIDKALKQLQVDKKVYMKVMGHREHLQVHLVLALPCMTPEEFQRLVGADPQLPYKGAILLFREHLFEEDKELSESEYNIERFKAWWEKIPDQNITTELIKDALARVPEEIKRREVELDPQSRRDHEQGGGAGLRRYIGTFSLPKELNETTQRTHTQNLGQAIQFSGRLFKRMVLTEQQNKYIADDGNTRVHLKGPPGSGRTTMLILKGRNFLAKSGSHHVIVLNVYRGGEGLPIGFHIFKAIENGRKSSKTNRVHHLQINLNDKLSKDTFVGKVSKLDPKMMQNKSQILFLVDEIFPQKYWRSILASFFEDFKECSVWCSDGLVPRELSTPSNKGAIKMKENKLHGILRLPPAVQSVLYHADWDEKRKGLYAPDAQKRLEVPTKGPLPVCVRHKDHNIKHIDKITDCKQCAEELFGLLKKMKLLEEGCSAQGASSQPSGILPCSIAVFFGTPRDLYEDANGGESNQIEITSVKFRSYVEEIRNGEFMKGLQELFPDKVNVCTSPKDEGLNPQGNKCWNDILVSWTDTVQGLEKDVVIFLPGDIANDVSRTRSGSPYQPLSPGGAVTTHVKEPSKSPQPHSSHQTAPSGVAKATGQPSSEPQRGTREIPVPGLAKKSSTGASSEKKTQAVKFEKKATASVTHEKGLARSYWRVEDVNRYSDWDKTSLVYTATRCTAQLILLIP